MSMFDDVRDFHIAFGVLVSDLPKFPDTATRELRQRILLEEVEEYFDAESDDDLIEVADALADIVYIVMGTMVSYGLGTKGDYKPLFCQMVGHAEASLPDGEKAASRTARMNDIRRAHDLYVEAEIEDDLKGIRESLESLMEAAFTCAYIYNIPLDRVFAEVHRSNMAKMVNGVVLRRADNKVQKPAGWQPPDIRSILFPPEGAPHDGA